MKQGYCIMKKIAFFQSDLGVGGIQKSLINLLSNIDYDEFEIDLYLSRKEKFWSQQFPEKLNIFYHRIFIKMPFKKTAVLFHILEL